jgi:hypothetical protein
MATAVLILKAMPAHSQDEGLGFDSNTDAASADATPPPKVSGEEDLAKELDAAKPDDGTDIESKVSEDKTPPTPEAPYPGSPEEGFKAQTAVPTPVPAQNTSPLSNERPLYVTEDGEYRYDTTPTKAKPSGRPGPGNPLATSERGDYFFETTQEPPKFSGRAGTEPPLTITSKGEFIYPVENSPLEGMFSFRFGLLTPPDLKNADNGVSFTKQYGSSDLPILFGDYEWKLTQKLGRLGIKLGSGLAVARGNGRFKNAARAAEIPDEKFTFLMFPNQLTAIYRFQYSEKQLFVPFIEGGGGYFGILEMRDDNKPPNIGGSGVAVAAGGVNFLLDAIDPHAVRQLDTEWGINHVWLTLEYRQIVGMRSDMDFTSGIFNAGFAMEF